MMFLTELRNKSNTIYLLVARAVALYSLGIALHTSANHDYVPMGAHDGR